MTDRAAPAESWGYEPPMPARPRVAIAALVAAPWVVVFAYLVFVSRTGILVTIVLTCLFVNVMTFRREGARMLKTLRAEPADAERDARLVNLAQGLATRLGSAAPELWIVPRGGPNAFVCLTPAPALAVTRSGLEDYTRTELEAAVAHGLVHLASGDVYWTTIAGLYGPLGGRLAPSTPESYDVAAAAVTRYPPAVASALRRSEARKGRTAKLWFAGEGAGQRPIAGRIEALEDL